LAHPDAGAPFRLTQAKKDDNLPAWSPGARFLAFVRVPKKGNLSRDPRDAIESRASSPWCSTGKAALKR
jgi:hypothetical protein